MTLTISGSATGLTPTVGLSTRIGNLDAYVLTTDTGEWLLTDEGEPIFADQDTGIQAFDQAAGISMTQVIAGSTSRLGLTDTAAG